MESLAESLLSFGYTPRQAQWMRQVMVHTGLFLRRQYVACLAGGTSGGVDQRLLSRLLAQRHAVALPYCRQERLYHIRYRPLYAAIGCEHSRLRRPCPPHVAAQRLLTLDCMLQAPRTYLESEAEKVHWFTTTLGIGQDQLPRRVYASTRRVTDVTVRYFVDRTPIAIDGDQPIFVVADITPQSAEMFRTFLEEYGPLLKALPRAHLVYVTGRKERATAAEHLYRRACRPPASRLDHIEALHQFFSAKRALAEHDYGHLTRQVLEQHEIDAGRFGGDEYLPLYERWLRGGIVELTRTVQQTPAPATGITFEHLALPWRYYALGVDTSFPARPPRPRPTRRRPNP